MRALECESRAFAFCSVSIPTTRPPAHRRMLPPAHSVVPGEDLPARCVTPAHEARFGDCTLPTMSLAQVTGPNRATFCGSQREPEGVARCKDRGCKPRSAARGYMPNRFAPAAWAREAGRSRRASLDCCSHAAAFAAEAMLRPRAPDFSSPHLLARAQHPSRMHHPHASAASAS